MATLSDYYKDLLKWEGTPHRQLTDPWPEQLIQAIEADLRSAVAASEIKGARCPVRLGSSNQSIGNQVEDYIISKLTPNTSAFSLSSCAGAGYPDRMLIEKNSKLKIPFEFKATSEWNASDSNRRVLTSSSEKIRRHFSAPIYHLICTVIYELQDGVALISAVRLDFLEPSTVVNVRLEASVSHKLLADSPHKHVVI
jgi:hypothetical protein